MIDLYHIFIICVISLLHMRNILGLFDLPTDNISSFAICRASNVLMHALFVKDKRRGERACFCAILKFEQIHNEGGLFPDVPRTMTMHLLGAIVK